MTEFKKLYCSKCGSEINFMDGSFLGYGELIAQFQENDKIKEERPAKYLTNDYVSLQILQEMKVEEKEVVLIGDGARSCLKVNGVIDKFYQKYSIPRKVNISTHQSIFLHMEALLKGYIDVEDIEYEISEAGTRKGEQYVKGYTLVKGDNYNSYLNSFWPFYVRVEDEGRDDCPLCGGELLEEPYKPLEETEKEVLNTLKSCDDEMASDINYELDISKVDAHTFIKKLVTVENNIKFFEKRLFDLFYNRFLVEMDFIREGIFKKKYDDEINETRNALKEIESELLKKTKGIEMTTDEIVCKYGIIRPQNIPCPQEPTITKPDTPIYERETFFNKEKIRKINYQRKTDYDFKMQEYEGAWSKYKLEYEKYLKDKEYTRILNEYRQKENARQADIENKKNELEQTLEMLETKVNTLEKNTSEQISIVLDKEIDEIKTMIKKSMDIRKKMHSSNIIFGKYLDYVAIITILEYFESGRCSELKGSEGAYNLYESELRQNVIIGKLDVIIKSLEDIKESQYLLYSAIKNVEKSVKYLSDETTKMVEVLKNIENNTTSINMNTAYIAYDTARAAEYAKRNAELTDAMGYLIALG